MALLRWLKSKPKEAAPAEPVETEAIRLDELPSRAPGKVKIRLATILRVCRLIFEYRLHNRYLMRSSSFLLPRFSPSLQPARSSSVLQPFERGYRRQRVVHLMR